MERHIDKEDIHAIMAILAHIAGSRKDIVLEIWNFPDRRKNISRNDLHDMITAQRTRMNDCLYGILASETMKIKYPDIKDIEKLDVSVMKRNALILLMIGMPVQIIADILFISTGGILALQQDNPEIFR